jgi:hypothetical protein
LARRRLAIFLAAGIGASVGTGFLGFKGRLTVGLGMAFKRGQFSNLDATRASRVGRESDVGG